MDNRSPEQRSRTMSRIRGRNTGPEMAIRKLIFGAGYRYRLHVRQLPGRPDLVFPGRRKVLFVNGCFWHMHKDCGRSKIPNTRRRYWVRKLRANVARDNRVKARLEELGWSVMTIWECEIGNASALKKNISRFLGPPTKKANRGQKRLHR